MTGELDRRTYDLLRLIELNEPIGSIRLVELMRRRGYSIGDRSVRLLLSDLDEQGLTEKVSGKGRRITRLGQAELGRGNVSSRLARVRERIATLTSKVTYDPIEDSGTLVAAAAYLEEADVEAALSLLESFGGHPLGPCPVAVAPTGETEPGDYRLTTASSITVDGVLLTRGIDANLKTAGIVEYEREEPSSDAQPGGRIVRYIDAISGEMSSVDVVTLLIEAGRTATADTLADGDTGLLIVDNREFPLTCFEEARDLSVATRDALGGVSDLRRPREDGPFPMGDPGWDFGSLTYGGSGELAISALAERGLASDWETLDGTVERNELASVGAVASEYGE
jgi:repressor of nif and glnA expression